MSKEKKDKILENRANIIGANIRKFLALRNMGQSDLAREIRKTPQAVYEWTNGRTVARLSTLELIAEALDVGLDDLIMESKNPLENEQAIPHGSKGIYDALFGRGQYVFPENGNEIIGKVMSRELTQRETFVLQSRYGWNCSPVTLRELGEKLHISRERVRQIEEVALRKLRYYKDELLGFTPNIQDSDEMYAWTSRVKVDDIGLTKRAKTCLKKARVKTLDELLELTERDIANLENAGMQVFAELSGIRRLVWTHPSAGERVLTMWNRAYWNTETK